MSSTAARSSSPSSRTSDFQVENAIACPRTARVRRLAVVRPYGMETPLEVSELLPPVAEYPLLTEEHLELCERALDAFLSGRWSQAFELLHRVPPQDKVADFLTVYIAQHDRTPPPNWDGVIALSSK